MATPDAVVAWNTLVRLFKSEPDVSENGVKWAIGCILAVAANDSVMPNVIELFEDPRHHRHRIAFILTLKRSRLASARAALDAAREDPELGREVRRLVGRPRRRPRVAKTLD
jgi:hypothetical protein